MVKTTLGLCHKLNLEFIKSKHFVFIEKGLSQTGPPPPSARVFYSNPSGQNNHLMGQRHPSGTYNQAPGAYYNNLNAMNSALIQQMNGQLSSGQTPFGARSMNGLNPTSGHQHTKYKTKQAFRKQPTN